MRPGLPGDWPPPDADPLGLLKGVIIGLLILAPLFIIAALLVWFTA